MDSGQRLINSRVCVMTVMKLGFNNNNNNTFVYQTGICRLLREFSVQGSWPFSYTLCLLVFIGSQTNKLAKPYFLILVLARTEI
jgi:hypothetical protein